jgi:hypothetical protein
MTELWRLAATDQVNAGGTDAANDTATRMLAAERAALEAEAKALQILNQELQRHRATAEKSLAEARALLSRREAALDEERSHTAGLEQALAQARLELEVLMERRRLGPSRALAPSVRKQAKRRKRPPARPARPNRNKGGKRSSPKHREQPHPSTRATVRPRHRRLSR